MPTYEFTVELTVPDNTAFTVLVALHGLGYLDLERVERADMLRLHMREGAMTPRECGLALTHAEVVFNPNKHRLTHAGDDVTDLFEAVVADKDDDATSLRELLVDHFGIEGLEGIDRATIWRLYDKEGVVPAARLEWACSVLLANPYSQTFEVRKRPAYALVNAT